MAAGFWGNLVLELRRTQALSQRQLALGATVNRATLRRIEEGVVPGDIDIVERLLNYLGYDLEALCRTNEGETRNRAIVHDPNERSKLAATRILRMRSPLLAS